MPLDRGFPAFKDEVQSVLNDLHARVTALEDAPSPSGSVSFTELSADPEDTFGNDGDVLIDTTNGALWVKHSGSWVRQGEFWLDTTSNA